MKWEEKSRKNGNFPQFSFNAGLTVLICLSTLHKTKEYRQKKRGSQSEKWICRQASLSPDDILNNFIFWTSSRGNIFSKTTLFALSAFGLQHVLNIYTEFMNTIKAPLSDCKISTTCNLRFYPFHTKEAPVLISCQGKTAYIYISHASPLLVCGVSKQCFNEPSEKGNSLYIYIYSSV